MRPSGKNITTEVKKRRKCRTLNQHTNGRMYALVFIEKKEVQLRKSCASKKKANKYAGTQEHRHKIQTINKH